MRKIRDEEELKMIALDAAEDADVEAVDVEALASPEVNLRGAVEAATEALQDAMAEADMLAVADIAEDEPDEPTEEEFAAQSSIPQVTAPPAAQPVPVADTDLE
jgi:hypothetical protein